MKIYCEVDAGLPETIRDKCVWRVTFRLSRYCDEIRDVRIVVRSPPGNSISNGFECLVWVRLGLRDSVITHGNSECVQDALSLAIDNAAALVVQYFRRQGCDLPGAGRRLHRQPSTEIVDS